MMRGAFVTALLVLTLVQAMAEAQDQDLVSALEGARQSAAGDQQIADSLREVAPGHVLTLVANQYAEAEARTTQLLEAFVYCTTDEAKQPSAVRWFESFPQLITVHEMVIEYCDLLTQGKVEAPAEVLDLWHQFTGDEAELTESVSQMKSVYRQYQDAMQASLGGSQSASVPGLQFPSFTSRTWELQARYNFRERLRRGLGLAGCRVRLSSKTEGAISKDHP